MKLSNIPRYLNVVGYIYIQCLVIEVICDLIALNYLFQSILTKDLKCKASTYNLTVDKELLYPLNKLI